MNGSAIRRQLEAQRWHFQHGPIDLVIDCDGEAQASERCWAAAWERFQAVLPELAGQLPRLRSPVEAVPATAGPAPAVDGPVAGRMVRACLPYAQRYGLFITPMAAVAGSVADEIVGCFRRPGILRACVNNGGDIALHLAPGQRYRVGVVTDLAMPEIDGRFMVDSASAVRGIATSGWRGRSHSLGIADSVTVLAGSAAVADAAATMIANQVDVDSDAVRRRPASELRDDSDLGDRRVTVAVGDLSPVEIEAALSAGAAFAEQLRQHGLIEAAALSLGVQARVVRSR